MSLRPEWGWPAGTYVRYCELLERWSGDASDRLGRRVAADEIEVALFRLGKES